MASNSVDLSSMLRVSGLSSGLDTESIVKSLMKVEQLKLDKLEKKKTLMDWRNDKNLEVNNLLRTFRDKYLSMASSDNVLSASKLLSNKVTMDASTSAKVTATKDAVEGAYTIDSITSIATGANVSSSTAVGNLSYADGDVSFKINGKTFSFSSVYTRQDIINTVNADSTANVTMRYSELTGKISIASDNLGADSTLTIENLTGNAFGAGSAFGIAEGTYANGTNAVLSIDGTTVTKDSNSFTIDGITYKLTGTTATAQHFDVEQDVESTVNKIKNFVDAYNTLYNALDDIVSDKKGKADIGYEPLTDEQKDGMSDKQIELWEARAKKGLLHNDPYVTKLLSDMRKSFYQKVEDAGVNANSIGLGTMSYLTKGTITLDESKLRKALQENPQQVASVFTEISSSTGASTVYSESGLAVRLKDSINSYINDATGYRKESFNDQYENVEDSIDRMEDLMTQREERYWSQYTALETAMAKLNSQSDWLSQQLSSMSA